MNQFKMPQDFRFNIDSLDLGLAGNPGFSSLVPQFNFKEGFGSQFANGVQGLASLYGLYNAHQQNKLAKKQFGFEVDAMNRNLSNQSLAFNTDIDKRTRDGLALNGIEEGSAEYLKRINEAKTRHVDGSAL